MHCVCVYIMCRGGWNITYCRLDIGQYLYGSMQWQYPHAIFQGIHAPLFNKV